MEEEKDKQVYHEDLLCFLVKLNQLNSSRVQHVKELYGILIYSAGNKLLINKDCSKFLISFIASLTSGQGSSVQTKYNRTNWVVIDSI